MLCIVKTFKDFVQRNQLCLYSIHKFTVWWSLLWGVWRLPSHYLQSSSFTGISILNSCCPSAVAWGLSKYFQSGREKQTCLDLSVMKQFSYLLVHCVFIGIMKTSSKWWSSPECLSLPRQQEALFLLWPWKQTKIDVGHLFSPTVSPNARCSPLLSNFWCISLYTNLVLLFPSQFPGTK